MCARVEGIAIPSAGMWALTFSSRWIRFSADILPAKHLFSTLCDAQPGNSGRFTQRRTRFSQSPNSFSLRLPKLVAP